MRRHMILAALILTGMDAQAVEAQAMETRQLATADLGALRWQARPVLVLGDPDRSATQLALLEAEAAGLSDRQMPVLTGTLDEARGLLPRLDTPEGFAVVLIGKDGGVKRTYDRPVDPSELFAVVDSMPMRRDEMRR